MFGHVPTTTAQIRAELARRRKVEAVVASMKVNMNLLPRDRAELAAHLADSASAVNSAHKMGGFLQSTAEVVAMLEAIATAVASPEPVTVPIQLDSIQVATIHRVLAEGSLERARKAGGGEALIEGLHQVAALWDRAAHYRPDREEMQAQLPPRVVADQGGWPA